MARKIFFSFHYERDAWRAGQVRNSNVVSSEDQYGFIDAGDWESIKKKGYTAIRKWIDDQLNNTSVTVVLIGAERVDREWVSMKLSRAGIAALGSWAFGSTTSKIKIKKRTRLVAIPWMPSSCQMEPSCLRYARHMTG